MRGDSQRRTTYVAAPSATTDTDTNWTVPSRSLRMAKRARAG